MKRLRATGIMARAGAVPFWGLLGAVLAIPLLAGPVGVQQPLAQRGGELPVTAVRQIEELLAGPAGAQQPPVRAGGSFRKTPCGRSRPAGSEGAADGGAAEGEFTTPGRGGKCASPGNGGDRATAWKRSRPWRPANRRRPPMQTPNPNRVTVDIRAM